MKYLINIFEYSAKLRQEIVGSVPNLVKNVWPLAHLKQSFCVLDMQQSRLSSIVHFCDRGCFVASYLMIR